MGYWRFPKLELGTALILGRCFTLGIKFLIPILIVRVLNKNDYGTYQKLLSIVVLTTSYFSFGIDSSVLYFHNKRPRSFFAHNFLLTLLIALIVAVCSFLLFSIHKEGQNTSLASQEIIRNISIIIFFSLGNLGLDHYFIAKNKIRGLLAFSFFNGVGRVLALLLVLSFSEHNVVNLISFVLLFESFKYGSFMVYFLRNEWKHFEPRNIINESSVILRYTIPFHLSTLIGSFGRSMERNFLLFFATSAQFALYSVAMFRIPYIDIIRGSIGNILLERISCENITFVEKNELFNQGFSKVSAIAYPSIILFFINSDLLITVLFTEIYIEASILYKVLLVSFIPSPLITTPVLMASNFKKIFLKCEVYTLIIATLLASLLVYNFQVLGACIAFSATTILNSAMSYYYVVKNTSFRIRKSSIFKALKLCMVYLVAGILLRALLETCFYEPFIILGCQVIGFAWIFKVESLSLFK